jgi:hypothetical protein
LRFSPSDQHETCSKCPNIPRVKISYFSEAYTFLFRFNPCFYVEWKIENRVSKSISYLTGRTRQPDPYRPLPATPHGPPVSHDAFLPQSTAPRRRSAPVTRSLLRAGRAATSRWVPPLWPRFPHLSGVGRSLPRPATRHLAAPHRATGRCRGIAARPTRTSGMWTRSIPTYASFGACGLRCPIREPGLPPSCLRHWPSCRRSARIEQTRSSPASVAHTSAPFHAACPTRPTTAVSRAAARRPLATAAVSASRHAPVADRAHPDILSRTPYKES